VPPKKVWIAHLSRSFTYTFIILKSLIVVAKQLFIPMKKERKKYEWYSCPFNKKRERERKGKMYDA